jgi:hypothetical protein
MCASLVGWMKNVKTGRNNPESSGKHHRLNEKKANKEWFDEECAKVNEEKNAAKKRAIHKESIFSEKRQGSST